MIITNLCVENIGPFVGRNEMSFPVRDPNHRLVLIGGKNGAGKTTLFNAIRTGLYGCRAYGYESDNSKYAEIIKRMINKDALISKQGVARIIISILIEDGKNDYSYTFDRSWKLSNKRLKEICSISRDGRELSETEKSDFQSFLLQLIPPDMFKFFFFDGEKISDFVFNGDRNTDFKAAFLKLCGLDTMEIIIDNFRRITNTKKRGNRNAIDLYLESKKCFEKAERTLQADLDDKNSLEDQLVEIDEEITLLEKEYVKGGGISKKEYQAMLTQINKEENRREDLRRWIKDAANETIPFIILGEQLNDLKEQLLLEENLEINQAMREGLNSEEVSNTLKTLYKKVGIDFYNDLAAKTVEVLSQITDDNKSETIINVSKQERLDLLAKINNIKAFPTSRIENAVKSIEKSLRDVKRIRKKLDISDSSGADEFFVEKEKLLLEKEEITKKRIEIERQIERHSIELDNNRNILKKAKDEYEAYLKNKSVSDTSARALLAFEDLQKTLYSKYIREMEDTFKASFDSLINKSDLLDGIKIDNDLQVYPYKIKVFKRSFVENELRTLGHDGFVEQFGPIALEDYLSMDPTEKIVQLPVEVKQPLSAGERQIFIMALYKALSTLNKASVPYIVDTPFARIDAAHRQRILNNFFIKLKGQIIILSTDEEITGEYRDAIEDNIGLTYLLVHSEEEGNTTIQMNQYFGGV